MSQKGRLDVVVTTSQIAVSEYGPPVSRPMTGIGQLDGAMICARTIGRFYRKKRLVAHMSVSPRNHLDGDLVLLGGLSSNVEARRLYDELRYQLGTESLYYNDSETNDLSVADWACLDYDLGVRPNGTVERDIGLIVLWANPGSPQDARRRAILCLGFSSYGTEAATAFAFDELVPTSTRALIRDRGPFRDTRRQCRTLDNCVICVVSSSFSDRGLRMGAPQLLAWASYGPQSKDGDQLGRVFRSLHAAPRGAQAPSDAGVAGAPDSG
jgi:hypothetical protein